MTEQKSWKRRAASLLATGTAAMIALTGALVAPTAAYAEEAPVASVTISNTLNLNPAGDAITVEGSGFDSTTLAASYYGVEGLQAGVYAQVGWIKDSWKPSAGGKNKTDRLGVEQQWVSNLAPAPVRWTDEAAGDFSVTFNDVTKAALEAGMPEGARPAVFTSVAGGGAAKAEYEFSQDITWKQEKSTAVAVKGASQAGGLTVSVDMKNFDGAGVYAALLEKGAVDNMTSPSFDTNVAFVRNTAFTDGAASASLTLPTKDLDRAKEYEVTVWKQHTMPGSDTILTRTPVTVSAEQWNEIFPSIKPGPGVGVLAFTSVTGATEAEGLSVKVNASGLPGKIYGALIEKGTEGGLNDPSSAAYAAFAPFPVVTDGQAEFTLKAPAEKLDRTKQYEVLLWKQHSSATPENIYARADVAVTAADWDSIFPAPAPAATTKVASATKANGLAVTVDMKNIAGTGVYAALFEKGVIDNLGTPSFDANVAWVKQTAFVDGSAGATLTLPTAKLDRTKEYEVTVWKQHSLPSADTILARTPVNVTAAQWDTIFKKDTVKPEPKPVAYPFADVKKGQSFNKEIAWMFNAKISTGYKGANGTKVYKPKAAVTRSAMAAFLFRLHGDASYKAPKKSPFADVKTTDQYYREISWMYEKGYSNGTKIAGGKRVYKPASSVTRRAMAAFLYRIDDSKKPKPLATSPFSDVKKSDSFYKEISWMSQAGLSNGTKQANGKYAYAPMSSVSRQAMAAFLYRSEH